MSEKPSKPPKRSSKPPRKASGEHPNVIAFRSKLDSITDGEAEELRELAARLSERAAKLDPRREDDDDPRREDNSIDVVNLPDNAPTAPRVESDPFPSKKE